MGRGHPARGGSSGGWLRTLEGREGLRSEVVDRVGLLDREEELRRGRQGYELRGSGARGRAQVLGLLPDVPGQPSRGEGTRGRGQGVSREFGENRSPVIISQPVILARKIEVGH